MHYHQLRSQDEVFALSGESICYNTTCQQSWRARRAVKKAFCTSETSQVFTTPPPTLPSYLPCHRAFVLPLPLPACLIYKLPTYSSSKIAVLVKSTDRISHHTITEHDFTNRSLDSLQTCCRQTHTLMIPTGHVCLKASKASLLWFHIGCTTCVPRAIIMWVRLYNLTVQGHDCEL